MGVFNIYISTKMIELKPEREALYALIPRLGSDGVLLHPWLFELDAPASKKSIREVYIDALKNSSLYIGMFWLEAV